MKKSNYVSYLKNDINFDDLVYGETIYEGEESRVLKVTHKKSSEIFVVKIICLRIGENELAIKNEIKYYEKFHYMLEASKSISHYYGYVIETSLLKQLTYHIVFKFYPDNLRGIINKKTISNNFPMIKCIFYQLINVLTFLQTCGICHRDIKPENILSDSTGNQIFLTDFGISVKSKELLKEPYKFSGTEEYRSPEWFKSHMNNISTTIIDPLKSDCFSLGLVLLEMGGITNNLIENESYDSFIVNLTQMIEDFSNKFQEELKKNENKQFFQDFKELLIENPDGRIDFKDIFIRKTRFENEKLKYQIFIQDKNFNELKQVSYKKTIENILQEIYETLENFFICPLNENGNSFKEKILENLAIIEKMTELNHPKALLYQGIFYEWGINVVKNDEIAKKFYEKSVSVGEEPYALYRLGIYLEKDNKLCESFNCFTKSANQGNTYGINAQGYSYNEGIGCSKDVKTAFDLYDKAANQGNAFGKFRDFSYIFVFLIFFLYFCIFDIFIGLNNIGNFYKKGEGCEKDLQKAFFFIEKSALLCCPRGNN